MNYERCEDEDDSYVIESDPSLEGYEFYILREGWRTIPFGDNKFFLPNLDIILELVNPPLLDDFDPFLLKGYRHIDKNCFSVESQELLQFFSNELIEYLGSEVFQNFAKLSYDLLPEPKKFSLAEVLWHRTIIRYYEWILPENIIIDRDLANKLKRVSGHEKLDSLDILQIKQLSDAQLKEYGVSDLTWIDSLDKARMNVNERAAFLHCRFPGWGDSRRANDLIDTAIKNNEKWKKLMDHRQAFELNDESAARKLKRTAKASGTTSSILNQCWFCCCFYEQISPVNGKAKRCCDKPKCKKNHGNWRRNFNRKVYAKSETEWGHWIQD